MSGRRRLTTSARVALAVTLTLAAGIFVLSGVAYWRVADRFASDMDRALTREAEAYSAAIGQPVRAGTEDLKGATRTYLRARSATASTTRPVLMVRFADGSVISNSNARLETASRSALDAKRARRTFLDFTYSGVRYRAATVPIATTDGVVVAVFQAALPASEVEALLGELFATLIAAGTVVMVLGAASSMWAARASLRPLRDAARTAEHVTQERLTERIAYEGPEDEVGSLVCAVNDMLSRLETAFGEQRRFVADASHELRTPLQVLSGHLELLERSDLTDEERGGEIALLSDEVARMRRLVDDLLALARLETGAKLARQPLDVGTLLEEAAALTRALGERDVRVSAPEDLWVSADPDRIMQAVLNLAGNAVAHTDVGGMVDISARSEGGEVVVAVADDGPGIPANDLPRVFDRFWRGRSRRAGDSGGSGIGLAIVRQLVEMHGGTVTAQNRPAGGAVFTVRLRRIATPE